MSHYLINETAGTSSGEVAAQIAACMTGTSIPRRSHIGVRDTAHSFLTSPVAAGRLPRAITLHRSRRIVSVCYRFAKVSIFAVTLFGAAACGALFDPDHHRVGAHEMLDIGFAEARLVHPGAAVCPSVIEAARRLY